VRADPVVDVPLTVAEAPVYEAVVFVIVAVDDVPGATPVTVTKPVLLTATDPLAVAVPDHVYPALKLEI
jgi:hypothetical protein